MNTGKFIRINILGIAYMLAILFICLIPAKMNLIKVGFFEIDKLAHFCIYLSLTVINFYGLTATARGTSLKYSPLLWAAIISLFWGTLVECLQVWLPTGRWFEWYDVIANVLGVMVAFPAILVFEKYRR